MIAQGIRPRALFYSHDVYGLGHFRRTMVLAGELARRRPDAALLALTGALHPPVAELPPNFDYVKLPSAARDAVYKDLPVGTDGTLAGVWRLREALIQEATTVFAPHVVVVDDTPPGESRELIGALASLEAADPRPVLIAGLRDIADYPHYTRDRWHREGTYDLLDRVYDRILVYGSREVFDPIVEYCLSPAAAAKVVFTGYLGRPIEATPPEQIRRRLRIGRAPLVVVTVGGGEAGEPQLRAYLAACRHSSLAGIASFVVTGPLLAAGVRAEIADMARGVEGVTLVPFEPDLPSYVNAADVVVTALGYNAACETVGSGKRVLAVPTLSEQHLRAKRFQALGLVTLLDSLDPAHLAEALQDLLAAPPPVAGLDFDGVRRFGDIIEGIVGPGFTPFEGD